MKKECRSIWIRSFTKIGQDNVNRFVNCRSEYENVPFREEKHLGSDDNLRTFRKLRNLCSVFSESKSNFMDAHGRRNLDSINN